MIPYTREHRNDMCDHAALLHFHVTLNASVVLGEELKEALVLAPIVRNVKRIFPEDLPLIASLIGPQNEVRNAIS